MGNQGASSSSSSGGEQTMNDAGKTEPGACAWNELPRQPQYLYFILDASGSMAGSGWDATRLAVSAFIDDPLVKANPSVGVGAFAFSMDTAVADFGVLGVPVALVDDAHSADIRSLLGGAAPGAGSPLSAVLEGQLPLVSAYRPPPPIGANGVRRVIVVNDGTNGTADDPSPNTRAIAAVRAATTATPPVLTTVIGFGDGMGYDEVFQGDLAIAGGDPTPGCTQGWTFATPAPARPCHTQVTKAMKTADALSNELLAAFRATLRSGMCALPWDNAETNPARVKVALQADGAANLVAHDAVDGWTFDNAARPTKILLHGRACEASKAAPRSQFVSSVACNE